MATHSDQVIRADVGDARTEDRQSRSDDTDENARTFCFRKRGASSRQAEEEEEQKNPRAKVTFSGGRALALMLHPSCGKKGRWTSEDWLVGDSGRPSEEPRRVRSTGTTAHWLHEMIGRRRGSKGREETVHCITSKLLGESCDVQAG